MKSLLDFAPVALLIGVYFVTKNMVLATAFMVGASIIALLLTRLFWPPVEKKQWITFAVLLIFGGLTVYFNNGLFIKWKPTIINWVFALILTASHLIWKQNLIKKLFDATGMDLDMPQTTWTRLNYAWTTFFVFIGAVNLYVAYEFSESFWMTFKFTGMLALNMVFLLGQGIVLWPYLKQAQASTEPHSDPEPGVHRQSPEERT